MSGENEGQQGSQPGHWLNEAHDTLHQNAQPQGQPWRDQAHDQLQNGMNQGEAWAGHYQDQAQDAYHEAAGHDMPAFDAAPAGEWVNGQWVAHAQDAQPAVAALDLGERDRLPWLDSVEDDEDYYAVDTRRVIAAVVGAVLLLGLIVGGIWAYTHRKGEGTPVADGSVIGAPEQPYKQAPANPGGKQFEGTGDTSFAAAQGKDRPAQLASGDATPVVPAAPKADDAGKAAAASAQPAKAPEAKPAEDTGPVGGVVQIAAYSNEAAAKAGWDRLVQQHDMLKGANHRIVQGQSDIGTVYRLQLITGAGGGSALCGKLKAEGVACQVKH
ncbi:MAG: SPOR domain-containing protein [Sphingomonadales bacterium]|nr:SPOR domain-containing protein [Sphingomonadales bacterium]MDE2168305.1 SPOR domain-containing protein [Sphingomonadales bacterium]